MIPPYGGRPLAPLRVTDTRELQELRLEAEGLPALLLNSAAAANAVMLGAGYFSPLPGYMNIADALSVADTWHTREGLFWPVPCLNLCTAEAVAELGGAERIALRDPNRLGHPVLAVQDLAAVEELSDACLEHLARCIFGSVDREHPGVRVFSTLGSRVLSGPLRVLDGSYFEEDFPGTFRSAPQLRTALEERGWRRTVAFQTRNPMHRAHEELCKMAMQAVDADGLLIHMLLGKLKPGDIPALVRDAAIRKMVELYFPRDSAFIAGYGFDMLYAGPREAVLHAIFRQNAGCSHLIVGRDHAGVGSFYSPFEAQEVFEQHVPPGALQIEIFKADHTAWSRRLGRVVMMRDAPDHKAEDFVLLSGTRVRELLAAGEELPEEFARPEVAAILRDHYRAQNGAEAGARAAAS